MFQPGRDLKPEPPDGGGPGAEVKAACLESRRSRVCTVGQGSNFESCV